MLRRLLLVPLLLVPVACSDDDDASDQVVGSPSASASGSVDEEETTTSSNTSTSSSSTTTTPFEGSTSPTSIATAASSVALLTDVTVDSSTVTFAFRDPEALPGVDAGYVTEVIADGSGEPVAVDGDSHLQIRMEPAAGVDLSSETGTFEPTYDGPDRIPGPSPIVEVVRTGDFEANLTWVIGLAGGERPYRVEMTGSTVVVSVAP